MKKAQGVFTRFLWVAALLLTACGPKLGIRQVPPEGAQLRKSPAGEKCNVPGNQDAKIGETVSFLEDLGSANIETLWTIVDVENRGDCGDGTLYSEPDTVRSWKEGPCPAPVKKYDPWLPLPPP